MEIDWDLVNGKSWHQLLSESGSGSGSGSGRSGSVESRFMTRGEARALVDAPRVRIMSVMPSGELADGVVCRGDDGVVVVRAVWE